MMDAEAVAKGLSAAQRRILLNLPIDGTWTDAYSVCKQRKTRMRLNNIGLTEPKRSGALLEWWLFRPTPLGLAVRALLKGE